MEKRDIARLVLVLICILLIIFFVVVGYKKYNEKFMPQDIIPGPIYTTYTKNDFEGMLIVFNYTNDCSGCGDYVRAYNKAKKTLNGRNIKFVENISILPYGAMYKYYPNGHGVIYTGQPKVNEIRDWIISAHRYV